MSKHTYYYTITGDRNLTHECDWDEIEKGRLEAGDDAEARRLLSALASQVVGYENIEYTFWPSRG